MEKPNGVRYTPLGEIPRVVDGARRAAAYWRGRPLPERKEYLLAVRDVLVDQMDEILGAIVAETGKTRGEALAAEVIVTMDLITYYAKRMQKVLSPKRVSTGLLKTKRAYKLYEPYGVVGIISPWNYPFYLTVAPVVTALAAGNTVIMKPSEATPLVGLKALGVFEEAAGRLASKTKAAAVPAWAPLVQMVNGGGEAGDALVRSGLDKVAFTGSATTGRKVMAAAAGTLTPLVLELGGKDPMIVCSDAAVERAANAAVWGAFTNTGQACVSVERVYATEAVYDRFMEEVLKGARKVKPGRDIGPMIHPPQLEIVQEHLADARSKGARVLLGGGKDAALGGLHYEPTVLTDVDHSMKVMREETFGPVLPVMKVRDEEEAVALANESPYGLNSSVFSRSVAKARKIAGRIDAGGVCINDCLVSAAVPGLPYGGRNDSGFGYTHGDEGLVEFSRIKAVAEDRAGLPREPQWYPVDPRLEGAFERAVKILYRRGGREKLRKLFGR